MEKLLITSASLALIAGSVSAGGIDRSGQSITAIFAETGASGAYAKFSFGGVNPQANSTATANPLDTYAQIGFAVKKKFNDQLSFTLIYDQPYGASVAYDSGLPFFGGKAQITSDSYTGILRFQVSNGFSVHGGIRGQKTGGEIFTIFDGTTASALPAFLEADANWSFGGVAGVAYERPDIALRVSLTYASSISQKFSGTESKLEGADPAAPVDFSAPTEFEMNYPESVNLDFQTGIAKDTLLFGSVRWAGWNGVNLTTDSSGLTRVGDSEYVSFSSDTTTYSVGFGRRINDALSVAVTFGYEEAGSRPSDTALVPTTGTKSIGIGASYSLDASTTLRGGITYVVLGDQQAPSATGLQSFEDNQAVGVGFSISQTF